MYTHICLRLRFLGCRCGLLSELGGTARASVSLRLEVDSDSAPPESDPAGPAAPSISNTSVPPDMSMMN